MICFINARVHTVDPRHPSAEAVVVRDRHIVFVGSTPDARRFAGTAAETIDLGGRLLLPGFIDDHVHFVLGGEAVSGLDTRTCASKAEFIAALQTFVDTHRGAWVKGGDWDHEHWAEKILPRKEWVDPFSQDTPLFLPRFDWHMALANSAALAAAGITRATPDPVGGKIERDPATGEPTGIVKDAAMDLVLACIPKPTAADLERRVRDALVVARKNGVTSIHDIAEPSHIPVYRKLADAGELTCRIFARLPLSGHRAIAEQRITHHAGDAFLRLGSMKAFSDGSLGSTTAWFFERYLNEDTCGLPMEVLSDGRMRAWALEADRNGLQLSIHAIGDRANSAVLDIFEEVVRTNPAWDRRFRIEHAQHLRPEDIARFAALGVIASVQPYHAIDDGVWAASRIGADRVKMTYAFRSMLDAGVHVCFGSDWTVSPLHPLGGIYAAVTRRTLDGKNPDGWVPEQKVSVEQAVRCTTINNAYASFEEGIKGSITPGKLGDMVVLGEDIFAIPPERIRDVPVQMTVVGGHIVHREGL
ncbi:MAG: amidohydrolase [Ignavibacteriae bacterium]|nr:amidohydrolase [Ignavibacteriota bacterium]